MLERPHGTYSGLDPRVIAANDLTNKTRPPYFTRRRQSCLRASRADQSVPQVARQIVLVLLLLLMMMMLLRLMTGKKSVREDVLLLVLACTFFEEVVTVIALARNCPKGPRWLILTVRLNFDLFM